MPLYWAVSSLSSRLYSACRVWLVSSERSLPGGILRLAQEVDRAAQAVKTLSEKALGIIGVALGQDGAVGHTLAVRDEIAQISAAIHPTVSNETTPCRLMLSAIV